MILRKIAKGVAFSIFCYFLHYPAFQVLLDWEGDAEVKNAQTLKIWVIVATVIIDLIFWQCRIFFLRTSPLSPFWTPDRLILLLSTVIPLYGILTYSNAVFADAYYFPATVPQPSYIFKQMYVLTYVISGAYSLFIPFAPDIILNGPDFSDSEKIQLAFNYSLLSTILIAFFGVFSAIYSYDLYYGLFAWNNITTCSTIITMIMIFVIRLQDDTIYFLDVNHSKNDLYLVVMLILLGGLYFRCFITKLQVQLPTYNNEDPTGRSFMVAHSKLIVWEFISIMCFIIYDGFLPYLKMEGVINDSSITSILERITGKVAVEQNYHSSSLENLDQVDPNAEKCVICMKIYRKKSVLLKINDCGHMFHVKCLRNWTEKKASCPMCLSTFETDWMI